MTEQIKINPAHDLVVLGQSLQQNGRLQVAGQARQVANPCLTHRAMASGIPGIAPTN